MLANGPNYKEKYLKKPEVVSVTFGCFYQADFCSYPHILSSGLVSLFADQVGGSLIFWLHPLIIRLQVTGTRWRRSYQDVLGFVVERQDAIFVLVKQVTPVKVLIDSPKPDHHFNDSKGHRTSL